CTSRTIESATKQPRRSFMCSRIPVLWVLCVSAFLIATVHAQEDTSNAPSAKSAQAQGNDHVVEGTVISTTRHTLVVRTDDDQYHLFTYAAGTVHSGTINPGARVRVNGSAPDEGGTRVADSIVVIQPGSGAVHSGTGTQAAQPP